MSPEIQFTQAIQAKRVVELDYDGTGPRVVEPYVLYEGSDGQLFKYPVKRSLGTR